MVFVCPRFEALRAQYSDLFEGISWVVDTASPVAANLSQGNQEQLAQFIHLCHETHSDEQHAPSF